MSQKRWIVVAKFCRSKALGFGIVFRCDFSQDFANNSSMQIHLFQFKVCFVDTLTYKYSKFPYPFEYCKRKKPFGRSLPPTF